MTPADTLKHSNYSNNDNVVVDDNDDNNNNNNNNKNNYSRVDQDAGRPLR